MSDIRKPTFDEVAASALLRRYLRAVTGDQGLGDSLTALLLPAAMTASDGDEASLLCAAIRQWRRLCARPNDPAAFSNAAVARLSGPVGYLQRQAGLLIDVFGLTIAQASRALDRCEGETIQLLTRARAVTSAPIGGTVLIVEDDPLVSAHLARIAERSGADRVLLARNAAEAFAHSAERAPDYVLCDYDLGPGPNGAAVVRQLIAAHDCVCLFVTAFPHDVLAGGEGEPAFIIGKPFRESVVAAALGYAASADRPVLLAA